MSNKKRTQESPFFLKNRRAMVSLGPLSEKKTCTFSCAFCYVQDGFESYSSLDVVDIISFLKDQRESYDIIYVSGDTDSFAPPRTSMGLELLLQIVLETDCDLLFTTRTKFSEEDFLQLKKISDEQKRTGNKLYACISITRLSESEAYLEPKPIPTPQERMETLKRLKEIGAITVLALRPFLPVVKETDYLELIEKCSDFTDIVLGECFYFIRNGQIQKRVFPDGIDSIIEKNITKQIKLPFDDNEHLWDYWNSSELEELVRGKCESKNIIFSMHSEDAINEYLDKELY